MYYLENYRIRSTDQYFEDFSGNFDSARLLNTQKKTKNSESTKR